MYKEFGRFFNTVVSSFIAQVLNVINAQTEVYICVMFTTCNGTNLTSNIIYYDLSKLLLYPDSLSTDDFVQSHD